MHNAAGDSKRMPQQRLRQGQIVVCQRLAHRGAADAHAAFTEGLGAGDVKAVLHAGFL